MAENPLFLLVDMDGVIVNFEAQVLKTWRQQYPERTFVPLEERRTFRVRDDYPLFTQDIEAIYNEPGFFENLPPIAGAIDALTTLDKLGHQVRICSSPLASYNDCVEEKYRWVDRNLGLEWIDRVILARDKTLIYGDILIDDRPELTGARKPFWEHVLFDQPYNRTVQGKRRLNWTSYREILGV